jgi:hypothetical protein
MARGFWMILLGLLASGGAVAQTRYTAVLQGFQEVPSNSATALGNGTLILNAAENSVTVSGDFFTLSGNPTLAHVHGPADPGATAPPIITFSPLPAAVTGVLPTMTQAVTPTEVADIKAGRWYFNIHTTTFPSGEIRGRILPQQSRFTAFLSSDQEVPTVSSANARGFGSLVLSDDETMIDIALSFAGLSSAQIMSHIHAPAATNANAGVAIDIGVAPGAVTQGEVRATRSISRLQLAQMRAGLAYFNVHTTSFPGGEIRAQIRPGMPVFAVIEGAQFVPPNLTSGRGLMRIYLDYSQIAAFGEVTISSMAAGISSFALQGPALPGAVGNVISTTPLPPLTAFRAVNIAITLSLTEVVGYYSGLLYVQVNSGTASAQIRGQIDGLMQDGSE